MPIDLLDENKLVYSFDWCTISEPGVFLPILYIYIILKALIEAWYEFDCSSAKLSS